MKGIWYQAFSMQLQETAETTFSPRLAPASASRMAPTDRMDPLMA